MLNETAQQRRRVFAERLRDSRIKLQLSQQRVAYLFTGKASAQIVNNWERGRGMPHACAVPELAALLGVRPAWLLGWED